MSTHEDRKKILYQRPVPNFIEEWYKMQPPCRLYQLLSYQDIAYLHEIATSVKLSGNPTKKKELISHLMEQRGFKRLDCGTNRIVYKFMEDQSFLVKVAFDRVAISDNLREFRNQEYLRPFCAKCFEVSPCGTVGMFERVIAVQNREQFMSIADRVFDIIVNCFLGKYILADFGTEFFKNWGVRKGAFPVIIDYPYLYELDPAKITCNNRDFNSPTGYCGGEIDYDDGFNFLVCKKCGKRYLASQLAKPEGKSGSFSVEREDDYMNITITKSDGSTVTFGEEKKTNTYKKPKLSRKEYRMKKNFKNFDLCIERGDHSEIEEAEKNKKIVDRGKVVETEKFTTADKICKDLEITIEKDGEKYVGKTDEPAYNNPIDPYQGAGHIYGTGAVPMKENNEDSETVYKDEESDDFNHNIAEVIRNIAVANNEESSKEEVDETVEEIPPKSYNVYQKYDYNGNMVSVDDPNDPEYEELYDTPASSEEEYGSDDDNEEYDEEEISQDILDEY